MINSKLHFCVRHYYDKDYQGAKHAHPCWELVFYCSGNGELEMNNKIYTFQGNTFSVIPPNTNHIEKGVEGTEVYYIGFDFELNEEINMGVFSDEEYNLWPYMKKIYSETKSLNRYSQFTVNLLTQLIVLSLIHDKKINCDQDKQEIVEIAKDYISKNYMKPLTIEDIAKAVCYSSDYLRHVFYDIEQMTVKEYVLKERLNNASEMLISGELSVKEIARLCGFSSSSHFCSVFKKVNKKSPHEFVKSKTTFQKSLYAKID